MGNICHFMSTRALIALCWCVSWCLLLPDEGIGHASNIKRNVGPVDKNINYDGYEHHEGRSSWNQTLEDDSYEDVFVDSTECLCTGDGDCSSGVHGSTYSARDIPSFENISAAIDYANTYICEEGEGLRSVALETVYELDFLIECFLCNQKTTFGSSRFKHNIMTAGTVQVMKEGMTPSEVLIEHHGTWSRWGDEFVDNSVPRRVALLDENNGTTLDNSVVVPIGTYAIFLVGNNKQLCEEDTYYTWGLMALTAEGQEPLVNVLGYVVCEKPNDGLSTDTTPVTPVTPETSSETSSDTTPEPTTTFPDISTDTSPVPTTSSTDTSTEFTTSSTDSTTDTSTGTTDTTYTTPDITTPNTTFTTPTITSAPYTTTTSPTTTTTTTTTSTTTTTASSRPEECCALQNSGDKLCPGMELRRNCSEGYSGYKVIQCNEGEVVVNDLCVADWINDVGSMIDAGNDSVVDIAEIVKNETETETPINQVELMSLVSLVTNMTVLLQKQIEEAEGNNSVKQELANQYTLELIKIEGNLFTYDDTWEGLDEASSGMLGTSLLHDLEKTGFILAQYVENEQMNYTDPTVNMTVISKPKELLSGQELFVPGEVSDTFIYLPVNFEKLLPPNETQARLVGYFLDQGAASRALPVGLSNDDEPKEMNSLAVSMTLNNLNTSVDFLSMNSSVIIRLQHAYRETGPLYIDLYRDRRENEVPSRIPGRAKCVYWDPVNSSWVTNGCRLINTTRRETFCSCSHLSMFSIITDVHKYMGRDPALDTLSSVLLSFSCLGLVLTLCILQFCRGVPANPRISITKQLSVSLLLSHFIILLFLDPDFLKIKEGGCKTVAVMLHFVLLASIFWMLAEGLNLFQHVCFVFDSTNYMIAYWIIGYGIPVVVVLVTTATALGTQQWADESYASEDSEYCWLDTEKGYIWAFTGPLVLVIVVNVTFMAVTLHKALNVGINKGKTLPQKFLLLTKASFSLNCILGVTWVFGLLYVSTNHFFAYVFTIFNASQGVMIFVIYCMLDENVRTAFIASLPEVVKSCLKRKKAADSKEAANRRDSRAATKPSFDFDRPEASRQYCHHDRYDRVRSLSDMVDLERGKCRTTFATNFGITLSTRRNWDRALEELREHQNQRRLSHTDRFSVVHRSEDPQSPRRVSLGDLSMYSVPARVPPVSKSFRHRKASEWSSNTQFSFVSDGESSRRNSMDICYLDGSSSSTSSSSPHPSTFHLPALNVNLENILRGPLTGLRSSYLSHIEEEQHTNSDCEDQSPSQEFIFWV